jgi:hypothetical protein
MTTKLIKPKWELHDLNNNVEHELYESLIVEFTDISGIEVDFYIRNETGQTEIDHIYGEPLYQNTFWNPPRRTKVIYEVTEEPTLTDMFGIVSEDQVQYAFQPKFTFSRDVSGSVNPKVGDVIKTIWNDRAYEVVDVGEEAHIFQLNKRVWEYILRPFRFSEQSDSARNISPFTFGPTEEIDISLESTPLTAAYAHDNNTETENELIDKESNEIDNYSDVDTSVYGF